MDHTRLNLSGVTSVLVDSDEYTRGLVAHILRGFGMPSPTLLETGAKVKAVFKYQCPDLCIFEAVLPDMDCASLIRWIRRLKGPVRFVPTIVLTGYTQLRTVSGVRDSGVNIVVKKPVSPKVLFDRMLWIARVARPFVETNDYMGPDRRFRTIEPPDGRLKRDTDDDPLSNNDNADNHAPPEATAGAVPRWLAT